MVKYYKTYSEEGQYLIYDVDKDYGFFFNKYGVFGYVEEQGYLCEIDVSSDDFYTNFEKSIESKQKSKAQRELLKSII